MARPTLATTLAFTLLACVSNAAEPDPVKDTLDSAKAIYAKAMADYAAEVKAWFDKEDADIRKLKSGVTEKVRKLAAERKEYEATGGLPTRVPAAVKERPVAAAKVMAKAFQAASDEYSRRKRDDAAEAVEKELAEFRKAGPRAPDAAAKDLQAMQGKWKCTREQSTGRDWSIGDLAKAGKRMEVAADRLTITRTHNGKAGVYDGRLRLDPAGTPKQFEWEGTGPTGAAIKMAGVYEVGGGKLRLCYRVGGVKESVARPAWGDILGEGVVCVDFETVK